MDVKTSFDSIIEAEHQMLNLLWIKNNLKKNKKKIK